MTDQPGAEVLARAQAGDADALGSLYDQNHAAVFHYLAARVAERQVAEDLTGEVFMRMLRGLPRYRAGEVPFRAWLYRIARNLLVDHYRKEAGLMSMPLKHAEDQHDGSDVISLVEHRLTFERVQRALRQIDELQREVVLLRFLHGLSLREVAVVLAKSENAVKALQHRGLTALRQALAKEQAAP